MSNIFTKWKQGLARTSKATFGQIATLLGASEITDETFEELVLKSERPTVVDFWAVWCGPCKMVAPEMEKLAEKYNGSIDVVKVDVDANPRLSQAFRIMSIPTIAFFRPGQQPMAVFGFRPLEQLEQQFDLPAYAVAADPATQDVPTQA